MPDRASPGGRPPGTPGGAGPGARPPGTPGGAGPGGRPPGIPGGAGPGGRPPGTPGGIRGGDPAFSADDGSADPQAAAALAAYASGIGSEHAALAAVDRGRLLVPIVPVPAAATDDAGATSEMAMPTLIGRDGRPAIPAFTSLDALRRWRVAARPVPVAARLLWRAAIDESCAVVIDVAGPVPLAVEGATLAALAHGELP